MSASREQILAKVRTSLGRSGAISAQQQAAVEQRLARPPGCSRPVIGADLHAHMLDRMRAVQMTITELQTAAEVPAAVAAYLREHELGDELVAAPALHDLPWPDSLTVRFGAAVG